MRKTLADRLSGAPLDRTAEPVSDTDVAAARVSRGGSEIRIDGWHLVFSPEVEQELASLPVRPDRYFQHVFAKLLRDPDHFRRRLRRVAGVEDQWSLQPVSGTMLFTLDEMSRRITLLRLHRGRLPLWKRVVGVPSGLLAIAVVLWKTRELRRGLRQGRTDGEYGEVRAVLEKLERSRRRRPKPH